MLSNVIHKLEQQFVVRVLMTRQHGRIASILVPGCALL